MVMAKSNLKLTATKTHSMVCRIDVSMPVNGTLKFFLGNDFHLDHPKCNQELLRQHLQQTVDDGGYILLNGDILCVMQGNSDKRHNKSSVRPEDNTDSYFDSVVDHAADFLEPFAHRILYMGMGNHESAIVKRLETNLLKRLCDELYHRTRHRIICGEYHGFIYVVATSSNSTATGRSKPRATYKIYHNHGAGGDAPITNGTIEDSRLQMNVEGVDAIWTGHNHNKYNAQKAVVYLDTNPQSMQAKIKIVEMIRSGTYKQEYTGHGFHIEKRGPAKPLGGVWLNLKLCSPNKSFFLAPSIEKTWHEPLTI